MDTIDIENKKALSALKVASLRQIGWMIKLVTMSSSIGIVCLVTYYAFIGFTPDVNLGQSAFVAIQAGVLGTLLALLLLVTFSMPVVIYLAFDIYPHRISSLSRRRRVTQSLAFRALSTQFAACSLLAAFMYFPTRGGGWDGVLYASSVIVFIYSILFLVFQQITHDDQGRKRYAAYWFASVMMGVFFVLAVVILRMIYNSAMHDHPDESKFLMALVLIIVLSSAQVMFSVRDTGLQILVGFVICYQIFSLFGSLDLPFRWIANAVGIAEKSPVGLVVPSETCKMIRAAELKGVLVACHDHEPTLLKSVDVFNEFGSRWLVRLQGAKDALIISGKDVVVKR